MYTVPPVIRAAESQTVVTAIEHGTFQLRFEIISAHPPVEASGITWRFNDEILLDHLSVLNGAGLSFSADRRTLTISNINYNISGRYFISAFNGAGRGSNFISLNVEGKHIRLLMYVAKYMAIMCINTYCICGQTEEYNGTFICHNACMTKQLY